MSNFCSACANRGATVCTCTSVGVAEVVQIQQSMQCAQGFHSWMPWLQMPSGSWATYCYRCRVNEQYDI